MVSCRIYNCIHQISSVHIGDLKYDIQQKEKTKEKETKMSLKRYELVFLCLLLVSSLFSIIPIGTSTQSETQTFRPFYSGYGKGTTEISKNTNITTLDDLGITREWNLIGWNVSEFTMKIRFCLPYWLVGGLSVPFTVTMYFSLDNGETFDIKRTIEGPWHFFSKVWTSLPEGKWYYWDFFYEFNSTDRELFTPSTRIKLKFNGNVWLANVYWGSIQKPVPPHDFIDEEGTYVQYYILFEASYVASTISYKGENVTYPDWSKTKDKMELAGSMILNCMQPSGATDEVIDKQFGKDAWIIIYSAQIAMMELLDLCKIFPEKRSEYLVAVKRFIVWMWSKQNQTDGSFPFILTDGDHHTWFNNETGEYYGADKIDSFSACAISLMRKYYEATLDLAFLNEYWDQIIKCKDFMYDLTNQTLWLPVDGYHYNGSHYTKSTFTWLHDVCETHQGFKDLAWLYGNPKENGSEQTYWNNFANSIASSVRSKMWNETLHRYVGMYYLNNETQNSILVYNVITPSIYGIETNSSRAWKTVNVYCEWGNMTGRYLDREWAPDYSVYNEYSTMSGMILSAFYDLLNTYDYHNNWMNQKFENVTQFLFNNPVYPLNHGDLQDDNGLLDWVNFVDETWAIHYARLIETSAWFIDGMMKLPNMTELFDGDEPWWEDWEWWHDEFDIGVIVMPFLGIMGIIMVMFTPYYIVREIKKKRWAEGIAWGIVLLLFGIGFVICWLWG